MYTEFGRQKATPEKSSDKSKRHVTLSLSASSFSIEMNRCCVQMNGRERVITIVDSLK